MRTEVVEQEEEDNNSNSNSNMNCTHAALRRHRCTQLDTLHNLVDFHPPQTNHADKPGTTSHRSPRTCHTCLQRNH